MFFAIKCISLKMLRTLPTIWINLIDEVPHCWIPKTGYSYKLKNLVPPPNETDVKAREEWYFSECEILFGKAFDRLNDGEMALSKMNYGPEWYYKHDAMPTNPKITFTVKADNCQLPSNESIEPSTPSEGELPVDSSDNELTVEVTEGCVADNPQLPSDLSSSCQLNENEQSCIVTEESVVHGDSLESEPNTLFTSTVEVTESYVADNPQLPSALSSSCQLNENEESCIVTEESEVHGDSLESESNTLSTSTVEVTESYVADNPQLPSNAPAQMVLSDLERYKENKRLCKLHNFKPPIHYKKFEKLEYEYVRTFNLNNLRAGDEFKTLEELSLIPRKYDTPFCRPGPLRQEEVYEWYLVDSIVQAVHLKNVELPFFVVRWVGYEDEYNTVESLANVKHTAVHKLFTNPNLYTACRLNGCVLRRSQRKVSQNVTVPLRIMDIGPSIYESTMNKLIYELRIEEKAGRYSPDIGFCSYQNVAYALLAQHRFFIDKFCLMIQQLKSPLYLDQHYIGPIFGTLGRVAEFKEIIKVGKMKIVDNTSSLKDYISRGFSNLTLVKDLPRYVSFVAIRKFNTDERKDKKKPNFHMCVFTVKCHGIVKDAIYYDPSPKYFAHQLPPVLEKLTTPVLETFTRKFGDASEKDDCTFQCMRYIIGLATGEIPFEPDTSELCRKIDQFKATKQMNSKRSQKINESDESDEAENEKKKIKFEN